MKKKKAGDGTSNKDKHEITKEESWIESRIQKDIDQLYKEEEFNEYLETIMDTEEDKQKFKILKSLSGIINYKEEDIFYLTVFAQKQGKYTPVVLTSMGYMFPVKDKAKLLIAESMDSLNKNYKNENGDPIYTKTSDVPIEERYQFFTINDVIYKFTQPVFWEDSHNIQTIDNTAIHGVINKKTYSRQIFQDLIEIIEDYFYHTNKHEYDVIGTGVILSFIKQVLGNVFYLCLFGGMGTGKSTVLALKSFLEFNGYFTGKGTVPSSCRLLHFFGVSLNQDEFEKMGKDEKTMLVNIFNTGFNSYGRYTLTNMGIKDIKKQTTGLKTFGMKSFTCNDLIGFDPSFIDRLYVILSIKTNKKLKNIYRLSVAERKRFQDIRNKIFVYCLFNWKELRKDIDEMKDILENEEIFGRETDKNSIILGVIKHFLGLDYANKVKKYIEEKAPVYQLEHVKTMEYTVLESIVNKFEKPTQFIDISNADLYQNLLNKLDFKEDDKYAPTNTKPRKILDSLGLTGKKENIGMEHGGKRKYHINTIELINVLKSNNYEKLLEKISWQKTLTTATTLTTVTKNGEGGEESEGGEDSQLHHSQDNSIDKLDFSAEDIYKVMVKHPVKEWHHTEIANEMGATISRASDLFNFLQEITADPKNETPIRRGAEKGYFHLIEVKWKGGS
jgi:hypothetical protein